MTSEPMTQPAAGDPVQDYRAAMREIHSNVEIRRLMFVVVNVMVPTLLMAAADAMSGSSYPPALRWLPEHILPVVGSLMAIGGFLVAFVLARCHMGMTINGAKMRKVTRGELKLGSLNWLGVTTNFVLLSGLSAGGGAFIACLSLGAGIALAGGVAVGAIAVPLFGLAWNHGRANRVSAKLDSAWNPGEVPKDLREQHATTSLDDTSADIAVIVTMAVALFGGAFSALTNLGGISDQLDVGISTEQLQTGGLVGIAGFLLLSLLLSCRMVVRLRIALAQHASTLAELRGEQDDPWRFKPFERTLLLYAVVLLLAVASAVMLGLHFSGGVAASWAGGGLAFVGIAWYAGALRVARP